MKGARCTCEQEADDHEDRIVDYADGDVLGHQGKYGRHDDRGEKHAADERGDHELGSDLVLLAIYCYCFPWDSIAGEIGTEDHEDQRYGHATGLANCPGDRVGDEGAFGEEEILEFGDRCNHDGYEHGP